MNDIQKAQAARILSCYDIPTNDLEKSQENDIEKGGEGARGGKVIGHTKSGKPIYEGSEHIVNFAKKHNYDIESVSKTKTGHNVTFAHDKPEHKLNAEGKSEKHANGNKKDSTDILKQNLKSHFGAEAEVLGGEYGVRTKAHIKKKED